MPERMRRFRPGSGRVSPEYVEKETKVDAGFPHKTWFYVLGGTLGVAALAGIIALAVVLGTSSNTPDTVSCGLFVCQAGGGASDGACAGWATECNGVEECVDGEDEANCTSECEDVQSCPTEPSVNKVEVADGCVEDVGLCEPLPCANCTNDTTHCCGPTNKTRAIVVCNGLTYPVEKILACGCRPCETPQAFISGKVTCNATDPCVMTFSTGGRNLNQSDADGDFGFYIDFPDDDKTVLTVSDEELGKYFPQQKIINTVSGTTVYYINIKMALKPVPKVFSSSSGGTFDYGAEGKFTVDFPPDSVTSEDGTTYHGQVNAYVGFIDPESEPADDAPSELLTENNDVMLSASMMRMSLEGDNGQSLNGRTSVSLDADSIPEEERTAVQFWDFSGQEGWNVQSNLTVNEADSTPGRRKRSTTNRLFGAATIRVGYELCNFDSILRPYCFLKGFSIRLYSAVFIQKIVQRM